jgi:hypothetical protein
MQVNMSEMMEDGIEILSTILIWAAKLYKRLLSVFELPSSLFSSQLQSLSAPQTSSSNHYRLAYEDSFRTYPLYAH